MNYSCKTCEGPLSIEERDITFCGCCNVVYHNKCQNIQKAVSKVLIGHSNILWLCVNCSNGNFLDLLKTNSQLSQNVEMLIKPFSDLNTILEKIDCLAKCVTTLNGKIDQQQELINNGSFSVLPNAKRLRSGNCKTVVEHVASNVASSSPVGSLNLENFNFDISSFTPEQQQLLEIEKQEQQRLHFLNQQQVYKERQRAQYVQQQQLQKQRLIINQQPASQYLEPEQSRFMWSDLQQQQQLKQQRQQQQKQQMQQQLQQKQQQQMLQQQMQQQQMQQHQPKQQQQMQQQLQLNRVQSEVHQTHHVTFNTNEQCLIKVAERVRYKFLYVSELDPTTTSDDMKAYITSKLNIPNSEINCQILVNRNRNRENLEFVSFKVGIKEDMIDYCFGHDFWPSGTVVREFQERQRARPDYQS